MPLRDPVLAALDQVAQPGALEAALKSLIAASPAGPEALFTAIREFHAAASATNLPAADLAALTTLLQASPVAAEALTRLTALLPTLTAAELARTTREGAPRLARNLVRLELAAQHTDEAPYAPALTKLESLDPTLRLEVALATAPPASPNHLEAAITLARTRADCDFELLQNFAEKYSKIFELLDQHPRLAAEKPQLAKEIARLANDGVVPQFPALLDALDKIKELFPQVATPKLLEPSPDGRPGLIDLVDPANDFRNPPLEVLPQLLAGAAKPALGNGALQTELARAAFEIAASLGHVGKDPSRYLGLVAQDFAAAARTPAKLAAPARAKNAVAVQADRSTSVAQFLRTVPELPREVALTAGLHLTPDQLAFVTQRITKNARDLSGARATRDFIFACVELNRPDLLEAARTSRSAPKAITATIERLAYAFRMNELAALPLDAIAEGLKAGRDPIADLDRAADAGTLAVDLAALTGGHVDPEGREELRRCAANINYLLGLYVQGGSTADGDVDMASLKPILLECIRSVADGTWPTGKYENAAGQRQMARLAPDQRAVWRSSLVTPMSEPANAAEDPGIRDAIVLLEGLAAALPQHIALGGEGLPPLGWDRASIDNLQAVRELAIEDLRGFAKGTPDHRRLEKQLAIVQENLALLELHSALEQTVGAGRTDPADIMLRLRPALESAATPLGKRGGQGFREAVDQILFATQDLEASPREGRYASDEDSFTALATSNTSGCLSPHWPGGPGRQWGIAGALADANVRMLRVFDNGRQLYRGFMKFFDVELPNYKGPILFLDVPVADGGGGPDDLSLWYRHAVKKAAAMGVPIAVGATSINAHDPDYLGTIAKSMGFEVIPRANARFHVDEGNTGYMHSDSLFSGKGNIRAGRGQNPTWDFDYQLASIVMPPKAGA